MVVLPLSAWQVLVDWDLTRRRTPTMRAGPAHDALRSSTLAVARLGEWPRCLL